MPISSFLAPSAIAKPGVCTSSTRPASPYEGQVIYETDTNLAYFYDGAAWQLFGQQIAGRDQLSSAGSTLSVTLPSITNGYNLHIVTSVQHATSASIDVALQFNSDTGTNYDRQYLIAYDATMASAVANNQAGVLIGTCGNNSANRMASYVVDVPNFQAAYHKTVVSNGLDPRNMTAGSGTSSALWLSIGGVWRNTAAITSVQIKTASGNFVAGSRMTVYVEGLG
jgi:hypothetical protein